MPDAVLSSTDSFCGYTSVPGLSQIGYLYITDDRQRLELVMAACFRLLDGTSAVETGTGASVVGTGPGESGTAGLGVEAKGAA